MPTLWIIDLQYLKPADEMAQLTPQHRAWLDQHYRSGVFLTSGRKVDQSGGILIAQAESEPALRAIFQDDPFMLAGCAEYRYTALTPVKRGQAIQLDDVPLVE